MKPQQTGLTLADEPQELRNRWGSTSRRLDVRRRIDAAMWRARSIVIVAQLRKVRGTYA